MSLIKIFILISVMLVVAFVSLKYFEEKEISDTATIVSIQPVEHEIIPTYIGLFVIMVGLGSLSFIYQIFIVIFIFANQRVFFNSIAAVFLKYEAFIRGRIPPFQIQRKQYILFRLKF